MRVTRVPVWFGIWLEVLTMHSTFSTLLNHSKEWFGQSSQAKVYKGLFWKAWTLNVRSLPTDGKVM